MSERVLSYTDLEVWKRSMTLVKEVFAFTSSFPAAEMFSLTNQIRRSAISIPANIAEGWGRETPGNYLQFLRNSKGSLFELHTLLILASELKYLDTESYLRINDDLTIVGKMLNKLISRIKERQTQKNTKPPNPQPLTPNP